MTAASAAARPGARRTPRCAGRCCSATSSSAAAMMVVARHAQRHLAQSLRGLGRRSPGQLFAVGAAAVCFGAPLLAGWVVGLRPQEAPRRFARSGYAVGHALCAAMPSYAALLPLRAVTMLGAAVFTPQAGRRDRLHVAARAPRPARSPSSSSAGRCASVLGLPMANWIGETFGWRYAFSAIAALGARRRGLGLRGDARRACVRRRSSLAAWKRRVRQRPSLMAIVARHLRCSAPASSRCSPYFTPYFRDVLHASTNAVEPAASIWFGIFGVIGNLAAGALHRPDRRRPAATAIALVPDGALVPDLAVRLGRRSASAMAVIPGPSAASPRTRRSRPGSAPRRRPSRSALLALNTSAIYLGQAAGASSGGWLIAHHGYAALSWRRPRLADRLHRHSASGRPGGQARRRMSSSAGSDAGGARRWRGPASTTASCSSPSTGSRCRASAACSAIAQRELVERQALADAAAVRRDARPEPGAAGAERRQPRR